MDIALYSQPRVQYAVDSWMVRCASTNRSGWRILTATMGFLYKIEEIEISPPYELLERREMEGRDGGRRLFRNLAAAGENAKSGGARRVPKSEKMEPRKVANFIVKLKELRDDYQMVNKLCYREAKEKQKMMWLVWLMLTVGMSHITSDLCQDKASLKGDIPERVSHFAKEVDDLRSRLRDVGFNVRSSKHDDEDTN
ncbi:hypothetical protein PHJA_000144400 [Phtheirospermum japonicum]|uniref:Uncharacterized protein n=1 Tax=Phtheirospermum japonicum TaxID=374723 RepID=A0A830B3V3_9LAMI|nr:hypothetical protein PHJA_000144400 [Phtheirospermum japonicum]